MDQLPDFDEDTPLSKRFLYPGDWWGSNDGMEERDHVFLLIEALSTADKVAITDNDCDGLGTAAIIQAAFPDEEVAHIEGGHNNDGVGVDTAIETVAEYAPPGVEVFITDLSLDGEEALDEIVEDLERLQTSCTVNLFDHHDWEAETIEAVEPVVDNFTVDDESEVCAADITFSELEDTIEENNPEALDRLRELSEVTRDHDLWIKELDRSDDLSDFSFWADTETYIETVRKHGADITEDESVAEMLSENREEKEQRIQLAVENAEWYDIEGWTVAIAYGDVYHSEVGNRLVNGLGNSDGEADIAAIIQPWNKVSLRSNEDFPYCSAIGRMLDGGGHREAAGCRTHILGASGYVSYEDHWETEGEAVKRVLLNVFRIAFQKINEGDLTPDDSPEDSGSDSDASADDGDETGGSDQQSAA